MKHIRPDEYYNDGIFELARFGNLTSAVNHMSPNQHNHYLQSLAAKYDTCVSEIDTIVDKIRSLVKISDPENLLNFLVSMNILGSLNKESEVDYTAEMNFQLRSIEYVQSILVSSNNTYNQTEDLDDEKNYYEILDLTVKLYSKIHSFYSFWAAKIQLTNSLTEEELNYSMMAQMMSFVRGNQYQIFRLDVLRELIAPHNKELAEIYGMTVDDLMKGLQIMEHNLSSGRLDAINDLQRLMDEFQEPSDFITDEYRNRAGESINQFIGIDLYNVKKHTKWPDSLIEDLSLGIGSDNTFFMHDQCNGWPVWELPVQRKPFIKLNGQSYCFDYYNLFDNFYRSLQTAIFSHGEQYKETWRAAQTDASEEMVSKLFTKLLPGCSVHRSNHYPINGGNAENDIIITHKDVLIIIEVKAGSFTYTPALFDLKAHKESLKNLIQKGEKQCIRTKNYILSCAEADFYTDDKLKHYSFSLKEKDFSQIYMLDVTVDSINEIASAIEKVQIANAQEDIISLSIEDLWVYADYFNSPAQFVHFLKQRFLSTNTEEVYTLDELDHLGLYIHHNMYTLQAKELGRGNRVHFSGYREDLDRYYANLYRGNTIEKPGQKIPDQIIRIIDICHSRKDITSPFKISNFLLDLSTDSKQLFVDWIYKLSSREKEKGYTIPAMHFGDASYCMIVNTPFVKKTELNVSDYIYANLLKSGRDSCFLFEIELDHQDLIINTYAKEYKNSDIPIDRLDELKAWGDEIVTERIKRYGIQDTRVKIGRNEQCPCGSGKKFKKCCGRKAVDP